ncbi:MAG: hydrogenase maturation nickel metallochaperone HypA [Acidobacteriota bacterium]
MHELSIAMSLIETASERVLELGGVRVLAIRVRIGRLSGVVPDALRFSFELAAAGTPVEQARLEIQEIGVTVTCPACGEAAADDGDLRCPRCHGWAEVTRGRELELDALEVVDAPANC